MFSNVDSQLNWLSQVKNLLFGVGLGCVWLAQDISDRDIFVNICKSRLTDIFIQEMHGYFQ